MMKTLSVKEALRRARKLGWTIVPRRKSGITDLTAPDGERFTVSATVSKAPLRLTKRLLKEG